MRSLSETKKRTTPLLKSFPMKERVMILARYCFARLQENNLPDVAGNISFKIILSIVPILAIMLAIFTKFPMFGSFKETLENYFAQGMLPPGAAKIVLQHLNDFVAKAANVGIVGALALLFTAISTISTINDSFERIFHIVIKRGIIKQILLYYAIANLMPMFFGVSIFLTSHIFLSKHGILTWLPFLNAYSGFLLSILWTTLAFGLLYRILPNRHILWKDAFAGGFFAAISFEIVIKCFAFFIVHFTSYRKVYGALAAAPVFIFWIYVSALIILLGAMVTALLPDIRAGHWADEKKPGARFTYAMNIIAMLYNQGRNRRLFITATQIEKRTLIPIAEIEACLDVLAKQGWIAPVKKSFLTQFSVRKRIAQQWQWTGDAKSVKLVDVLRLFIYQAQDNDEIGKLVDQTFVNHFNTSLQDYFNQSLS